MKRFLTLVLMLCVGLCAGCAQNQQPDPQKPENGTLTAEELEEFQAMFTPGSWYSQAPPAATPPRRISTCTTCFTTASGSPGFSMATPISPTGSGRI